MEERDFFEQTGDVNKSTLYSDIRWTKFTFPSVEFNSIIEYTYTKEITDIPSLRDIWKIQEEIPTICNQFVLRVPNQPRKKDGG